MEDHIVKGPWPLPYIYLAPKIIHKQTSLGDATTTAAYLLAIDRDLSVASFPVSNIPLTTNCSNFELVSEPPIRAKSP